MAVVAPKNGPSKTPSNSSNPLSKKDRGRLKKLLRRASTVRGDRTVSGIAGGSDWRELRALLRERGGGGPIGPENTAPRVGWREGRPRRSDVDAASHRDLLLRLVSNGESPPPPQNDNSGKKRKRKGSATAGSKERSFGWACVHNPAAVSSVGVLEVHVDGGGTADDESAVDWLRRRAARLGERRRRHVLVAPAAYFPENRSNPRSVADALMYRAPSGAEGDDDGETKPAATPAACTTLDDLVARLEPLLLTAEQLERNYYPIAKKQETTQTTTTTMTVCDDSLRPQDIPLEEARTFVRDYQTETEGDDPQSQLAPYVVQRSPKDPNKTATKARGIFAMDAEMVETNQGKELARVTLCRLQSYANRGADIETELVFDVLVRPRNAVVNYWTQYSGVTAAMLDDRNNDNIVRLEQVQAALLRTVGAQDIVIGHSLENDLQATRWIHGTVIDTAVLFRPATVRNKFSLKHLAAVLLDLRIQQSERSHCSEEDAVTALKLAVRRAAQGPSFSIRVKPSPTNWLAQLSTDNKKKRIMPRWLASARPSGCKGTCSLRPTPPTRFTRCSVTRCTTATPRHWRVG